MSIENNKVNEHNMVTKDVTPATQDNIKAAELTSLLLLAKNKDKDATEKLIKQFYGLIVFHSKGIFLKCYSFDDLVQTGILSLLKAIENFDIDRGIESFTSYVFWCIKNNFNYLCRQEIRYNQNLSLNTVLKDDMESIEFIPSDENLEEVILKTLTYEELQFSLQLLDSEELDLIIYLYFNNSKENNHYLSTYAKLKEKSYYYCTYLKKRALKKLKANLGRDFLN